MVVHVEEPPQVPCCSWTAAAAGWSPLFALVLLDLIPSSVDCRSEKLQRLFKSKVQQLQLHG